MTARPATACCVPCWRNSARWISGWLGVKAMITGCADGRWRMASTQNWWVNTASRLTTTRAAGSCWGRAKSRWRWNVRGAMARGPALILLLPCLALAQPLPEAYLRTAEHFRVPPELLWAVTQTESGTNLSGRHLPWPWTLNISGTKLPLCQPGAGLPGAAGCHPPHQPKAH